MEENNIPTPTGLNTASPSETPSPAPTPDSAPEEKTSTAPEPEEQEDDSSFPGLNSLLDVNPCLVIACSSIFSIVCPFLLWILWKDKDSRIDEAGRTVLNVQATAMLFLAVSAATTSILIGYVLLPLAFMGWIFATVAQIIKFSNKEYEWTPPGTIRFLR